MTLKRKKEKKLPRAAAPNMEDLVSPPAKLVWCTTKNCMSCVLVIGSESSETKRGKKTKKDKKDEKKGKKDKNPTILFKLLHLNENRHSFLDVVLLKNIQNVVYSTTPKIN